MASAFLKGAPDQLRARLAAEGELERVLAAQLRSAHEAWPSLRLSDLAFVAYLARRLPAVDDPLAALRDLRAADLYLACACGRRDAEALDLFYKHYYPGILQTLRRARLAVTQCEEVAQSVVLELLDPEPREEPLIARFAGRGSLAGWLKVICVRRAMSSARANRRLVAGDDALEIPSIEDDIELKYMKRYYRKAFKQAFLGAIQLLDDRQVTLLRQHYVDGVNTRELGSIYRVHQTTAARWLRQAQEELQQRTREELVCRLDLGEQDYASIIRLIQSQMALSICEVLGPPSTVTAGDGNTDDVSRGNHVTAQRDTE